MRVILAHMDYKKGPLLFDYACNYWSETGEHLDLVIVVCDCMDMNICF
jgi:hypothetical protein